MENTPIALPRQGFHEVNQANWIPVGDGWYEARDPEHNKLMFRYHPRQRVIEWAYRRNMTYADLTLPEGNEFNGNFGDSGNDTIDCCAGHDCACHRQGR